MQRQPMALECPQGCFPLAAESRLYICALVFAGAPPERPRSLDEQGAAWNKAWQCGGFEVPAIV